MSAVTTLAPDAAMALGIAATAMPFARTPEDEAERWLRVLRLHGQAGIMLQALGVSEGALPGSSEGTRTDAGRRTAPGASRASGEEASAPARDVVAAPARDVVAQVSGQAAEIADRRGAAGVQTRDLLAAVIELYGEHFDRVLRAHGTDSGEVLEHLAA